MSHDYPLEVISGDTVHAFSIVVKASARLFPGVKISPSFTTSRSFVFRAKIGAALSCSCVRYMHDTPFYFDARLTSENSFRPHSLNDFEYLDAD